MTTTKAVEIARMTLNFAEAALKADALDLAADCIASVEIPEGWPKATWQLSARRFRLNQMLQAKRAEQVKIELRANRTGWQVMVNGRLAGSVLAPTQVRTTFAAATQAGTTQHQSQDSAVAAVVSVTL